MEASQDRKDTSFESSEATATDTSFADTNGNAGHGSNSSSGTSISAHGRTWSQASLAHRRGRSSLSSLSPKGSSSSQSPSMDNGAFQQPSSRRNSANGLAFSGVNTEPKAASAGKVEAPAYMGQALNAPTPLMRSVSAQNVLPDPSQSLINRPSTVAPMDVGVSSSTLAPTEPTSAAGGGYSQLGLGVPPGVSSMARQASQPFAPRSRSASRSRSGSGSALEPVGHQAAGFNLAAMSRNPSATHGLGLKDVLKVSRLFDRAFEESSIDSHAASFTAALFGR